MIDTIMYCVLVLMGLLTIMGMVTSVAGAYARHQDEREYKAMRRVATMDDAHNIAPMRTRYPQGWWVKGRPSRIVRYHKPMTYTPPV